MLKINEAPPSINAGGTGSRRHWSAAAKEKIKWEGTFMYLLLEQRVRKSMLRCSVQAWLTFKEKRRRDSENYRPSVSKPLADVLVKAGYLPDDTDEFFEFTRMHIATGLELGPVVKAHLAVELLCEYDAAS